MKKFSFFFLAFTIPSILIKAQNTPWPATSSSSNVGIGTQAPIPNSKLDLQGGGLNIGANGQSTYDATIHVKTTFGGWDRLTQMAPSLPNKPGLNLIGYTNPDASVSWWSWGALSTGTWAIQPNWQFGGNAGLFIDRNGFVGIGTSTPMFKQHVKLSDGFSVIQRENIANYTGHYYVTGPDNAITYNFFTGLRENSGNYSIYNGQRNADAITVKLDNNYVGIGVPNPSNKLDVDITTNTEPKKVSLFTNLGTNAVNTPVGGIRFSWYGTNNAEIQMVRGFGASDGAGLSFHTSGEGGVSVERMRIDKSGNVGIGTSDPQSRFAVNGGIRAKEVKVEAVNWPDYVFNSTYQLPSLTSIKEYIESNKHLPGVPSASEVAEEGVNLGETNKVLLKKIEELTLYLIKKDELDKRIKIRLDLLERKLKRIKKQGN